MSRSEFPHGICDHCGIEIWRSYRISTARAARPKLCSHWCRSSRDRSVAANRRSDRFWSKVDRTSTPGGCHEWRGLRDANGYGRFQWETNRPRLAHRVAYELATDESAEGMNVLHSCDNPPCCNPKHLRLGTQADNVSDMHARGRAKFNPPRGENASKTKLTAEQAIDAYRSTEPDKAVALRLNVTPQAIYRIRRGLSWRHVTGAQHG